MNSSQINSVAAVTTIKGRGRPADSVVPELAAKVAAKNRKFTTVSALIEKVRAMLPVGHKVSDGTIRRYLTAALNEVNAVREIKKTAEQIKVASCINLTTPNYIRSGKTNIRQLAVLIQTQLKKINITRSVGYLVVLLKKKMAISAMAGKPLALAGGRVKKMTSIE